MALYTGLGVTPFERQDGEIDFDRRLDCPSIKDEEQERASGATPKQAESALRDFSR